MVSQAPGTLSLNGNHGLKKRILLICPDYYGYDRAIEKALVKLGHSVIMVSYRNYPSLPSRISSSLLPSRLSRSWAGHSFSQYCARVNKRVKRLMTKLFDMMLVVKGEILDPALVESFNGIRVSWLYDNPFEHRAIMQAMPFYHYRFLYDEQDLRRLETETGLSASFLPLGYDPDVYHPMNMKRGPWKHYGSEVSFVGAHYPEREKVLRALADFKLGIWGGTWKPRPWRQTTTTDRGPILHACRGAADERKAVRIYNASAVNLNIHGAHTGLSLNARFFEIPGSGGFELVDHKPGISSQFVPGTEIETWRSMDELRDKLRYYLSNPDRRNAIASAGLRRARASHTFGHRMALLMKTCFGT